MSKLNCLGMGVLLGAMLLVAWGWGVEQTQAADPPTPLDPTTLTKYVDALPIPPAMQPVGKLQGSDYYEITATEVMQKLHSELPETKVWGYNGSYPSATIEARSSKKIYVKWINGLPSRHIFPIDTNIVGALADPEVRIVTHLHGGHTPAAFDGWPHSWFAPGGSALYEYPNKQDSATLWFHDHAVGITRLNVYAGLAGFYLIRDSFEGRLKLPSGAYEIPLVIQDRQFDTNGQLMYPFPWAPEFFGDTILVNGKVWPSLEIEPRKYRFRFLNGSQARFYNLKLVECDQDGNILDPVVAGPVFNQIGAEGGLMPVPVAMNELLIAPGERADTVMDFSGLTNRYYLLVNDAVAPYPSGDLPDPATTGQIMMIKVTKPLAGKDTSKLPAKLRPIKPLDPNKAVVVRDISLEEILDADGNPIAMKLNGKGFHDPVTEFPRLNTVEVWQWINLTVDTHPMHQHLVLFQVLDRQPFDVDQYMATGQIVFTGPATGPYPNERGFKDTVQCPPGEITRTITRFTDYTGMYVYHCHILEHEDNDMMRPMEVLPPSGKAK